MATAIPPELVEAVLQKAAARVGTREISAWLLSEHGVSASHMTVARLVQREGVERADVAKTIARRQLSKSVATDLDRFENFARKAMRLARANENDPELWCKLADQVRKFTVEKLTRSGVDTPDDTLSELAAAERRVAGRIALLLTEEEGDMGEPDPSGEGGA